MQRLFTTFPGGLFGLALLILRSALGVVMIAQSVAELGQRDVLTTQNLVLNCLIIVLGTSVLVGIFTPISSFIIFLIHFGKTILLFTQTGNHTFLPFLFFAYISVTAFSCALLGAGIYSLDAKFFGRREIIIPKN